MEMNEMPEVSLDGFPGLFERVWMVMNATTVSRPHGHVVLLTDGVRPLTMSVASTARPGYARLHLSELRKSTTVTK